ncbi:MAG: hypothetical protein HQL39_06535, partial [Alphaproteobacteria bacterium]|nr:hypothetical protein [Alphaproteobacteria bacterium]
MIPGNPPSRNSAFAAPSRSDTFGDLLPPGRGWTASPGSAKVPAMPREQRRIIFSQEELFQAMTDLSKAGKSGPPLVGKLISMDFVPQREPALTVTLQPPNSSMPQQIGYRKAEVAA